MRTQRIVAAVGVVVVAVALSSDRDRKPRAVGTPLVPRFVVLEERASVVVDDRHGQIEQLAAQGHLVAWTIRTPANSPDHATASGDPPPPSPPEAPLPARLGPVDDPTLTVPTSTVLAVFDERSGARATFTFRSTLVLGIRMLHGPSGAPQLAARTCTGGGSRRCVDELFAISSSPLRMTATSRGADATAAIEGRSDRGRTLVVEPKGDGDCTPPISVQSPTGGAPRALPPVPKDEGDGVKCVGLTALLLDGRYAFATQYSADPAEFIDGSAMYGIDIDGGSSSRWRSVQSIAHSSGGGGDFEIGPAVTDGALYWETTGSGAASDDNDVIFSVERVLTPHDVVVGARFGKDPTTSDPLIEESANTCAFAATADAFYELDNERCAADPTSDSYSRIVRRTGPLLFVPDVG